MAQMYMGMGVGMEQLPSMLALWFCVEEGALTGEDEGSGDDSDGESKVLPHALLVCCMLGAACWALHVVRCM